MKDAYAYPGQSEAVRIGIGRAVYVMKDGWDRPRTVYLTWRDKPYPAATHTVDEFKKEFNFP